MKSGWIINKKGFELYRFGDDKNLYKLPFISRLNYYGIRLIKKQSNRRWYINGNLWSERQLRRHIKIDINPVELVKDVMDCPF